MQVLKIFTSSFRDGNQVLQHQAPDSWVLEDKDSEGGLAHIPLGATGKPTGGLPGTPRGPHSQDDATRTMSALPTRSDNARRDSREGKGWQRGIVTQLGEGDMVTIALRDWGRAIQRPYHDIYILEDRFRELEWQAIPCGLGHIQPVGARTRWP